jgi:hypothetical protein
MAELAGQLKIGGIVAGEREPLPARYPRGDVAGHATMWNIRGAGFRPRYNQDGIAIPCPVCDLDTRSQTASSD